MAGLLSNLFDANDPSASGMDANDGTGFDADPQASGASNGGGHSESSQDYDTGGHGGIDLSPSVGVSHHGEGSWEDADGTTHEYDSDTDVVLTADASAAFGTAGSLTQWSAGDG